MPSETIPNPGTLYVVATPIGNLADITYRAVEVLGAVQLIAAEDTRHSARLLQRYGIGTPCMALHEHNERAQLERLIGRLKRGDSIALISDAGTPLISDPGYLLVREAREQGLGVVPVPGPSAFLAALSVSGLPTNRFCFEGFLPPRDGARRSRLEALRDEERTLVFYESPRRIGATLRQMSEVFGAGRPAVITRELTKSFETIHGDALENLCRWMEQDSNRSRGEFVLLVAGAAKRPAGAGLDAHAKRVAQILAAELPSRQAAELAAKITGERKNLLYEHIVAPERRS
ncbi:MAG TPA: 16S rRNA (cytidine(1402)-2'-O)-methyltransferase [Gammaproteobacteria bacterium]|nr:16S rRNA (cytidine(1402)-2'-O)-methyltransferase [Gammaproteobacteria bacterium]